MISTQRAEARVVLRNLPINYDDKWIRNEFSRFGELLEVDFFRRYKEKKPDISIYIQFTNKNSANNAVKSFNGKMVKDLDNNSFFLECHTYPLHEDNNMAKEEKRMDKKVPSIMRDDIRDISSYVFPRRTLNNEFKDLLRPKTPEKVNPYKIDPEPPREDPKTYIDPSLESIQNFGDSSRSESSEEKFQGDESNGKRRKKIKRRVRSSESSSHRRHKHEKKNNDSSESDDLEKSKSSRDNKHLVKKKNNYSASESGTESSHDDNQEGEHRHRKSRRKIAVRLKKHKKRSKSSDEDDDKRKSHRVRKVTRVDEEENKSRREKRESYRTKEDKRRR